MGVEEVLALTQCHTSELLEELGQGGKGHERGVEGEEHQGHILVEIRQMVQIIRFPQTWALKIVYNLVNLLLILLLIRIV
jgi:hypothetical protein